MVCAVCNRESNNRRVCPFCFTPYPPDRSEAGGATGTQKAPGPGPRPSSVGHWPGAEPAAPAPPGAIASIRATMVAARAFVLRQSPIVRWSGLGIVFVTLLWTLNRSNQPKQLVPGSRPSNIIASEMERGEAIALVKRTRETALVETQADEVSVSYPAATFPILPEGQFALAQQFARADELVEGRKRRILFYSPSGRMFAHSDGVTGVTVAP